MTTLSHRRRPSRASSVQADTSAWTSVPASLGRVSPTPARCRPEPFRRRAFLTGARASGSRTRNRVLATNAVTLLTPGCKIDGGIEVAVKAMSVRTGEESIRQCQFVVACLAYRTYPARWIPAIRHCNHAVTPSLLVVDQPGELPPSGIRNSSGESVVRHHAGDVQIFEDEPVVGLDQLAGDLVKEMPANVADTMVMPTQFRRGLIAVPRALLFA